MSQTVHVREARIEDSEALAHIQVDSYRSAYAHIFPPAYLDHFTYEEQTGDWRDLLNGAMTDILLVAETSVGDVVGYALGRPGPTDISPYDSELVALHVRQGEQHRGIGTGLIRAMARHLCEAGCATLLLWVLADNPARAVYEKLGGQLIGEKVTRVGDGDITAPEVAYGWSDIQTLL